VSLRTTVKCIQELRRVRNLTFEKKIKMIEGTLGLVTWMVVLTNGTNVFKSYEITN